MDTNRVHAHDQDDTVEAHYASLERLCACLDGYVFVGYLDVDEETGEEVERHTRYRCHRCGGSENR